MPEITTPELTDYLIIQKASGLVGKVKLLNLTNVFGSGNGNDNGGDGGDNNGEEEEVRRVFNSNEPTEKEEGLEWCELDGNKSIIYQWFWLPHPSTQELCWRTANKTIIVQQQSNNESICLVPLDGSNDLYLSSILFTSVSNNSQLQVMLERLNGNSIDIFKEIFVTSSRYQESLYTLQQGNNSGNAIIRIKAIPSNNQPYLLISSLEYCIVRFVYSGGW